jgi:hypothetical protein
LRSAACASRVEFEGSEANSELSAIAGGTGDGAPACDTDADEEAGKEAEEEEEAKVEATVDDAAASSEAGMRPSVGDGERVRKATILDGAANMPNGSCRAVASRIGDASRMARSSERSPLPLPPLMPLFPLLPLTPPTPPG